VQAVRICERQATGLLAPLVQESVKIRRSRTVTRITYIKVRERAASKTAPCLLVAERASIRD
jgi:hypothetical protein